MTIKELLELFEKAYPTGICSIILFSDESGRIVADASAAYEHRPLFVFDSMDELINHLYTKTFWR